MSVKAVTIVPKRLDGKTVLVTGASAGIGRATALALAAEGASVIATARREPALRALAEDIAGAGGSVRWIAGDIDEEAFIQTLAGEAASVDILVNNAGILNYAPLLEMSPDDSTAMFRTNVLAALRVAQVVGRAMVARGSGHIIMITSGAAREVPRYAVVYSATKHALAAITAGLRMELQEYGVKVSEIAPGSVDTGIRDAITHPAVLAAIAARPVAPLAAEDVANAIVFAATAPDHCTTQLLDVRPR